MFSPLRIRLALVTIFSLPVILSAQAPAKWSVAGNATNNGDFIGTTNNNPLVFYTNNLEAMRLKANGELKVNSLGGSGRGLITTNNNGVLSTTAFPQDTNKVFTGNGQFRNVATLTGWTLNGNDIYNTNPGDIYVSGTVHASGLLLANKLEADTLKGASMVTVNNNLNLRGGALNEMYTFTGDIRIQSKVGYNGNTILNAGNSGNVGVGIFSPAYKFDVLGDARVSGKMYVYRMFANNGDSTIRFGDSTLNFNYNLGTIFNTNSTGARGLGLGINAFGYGQFSTAIGNKVFVSSPASKAVIIGSGPTGGGYFSNTITNSLMIGFNTTVPTFFVGPANGANTIGKVGIGTSNPLSLFQVGEGGGMVTAGPLGAANTINSSYVAFNMARQSNGQWITSNDGANNGATVMMSTFGGDLKFISIPTTGTGNQAFTDVALDLQTQMQITREGRVIIGQPIHNNSPYNDALTRLTVNGRILCKDVVVDIAEFPDYVFDVSYHLLTIDSLKQYVNANKHLPATPSAAQQQQNGTSLSTTCKQQQQQIEELTLYIIQLNERINALEADKNNPGN